MVFSSELTVTYDTAAAEICSTFRAANVGWPDFCVTSSACLYLSTERRSLSFQSCKLKHDEPQLVVQVFICAVYKEKRFLLLIRIPSGCEFLLDFLFVHIQQREEAGEAQRCPVHAEQPHREYFPGPGPDHTSRLEYPRITVTHTNIVCRCLCCNRVSISLSWAWTTSPTWVTCAVGPPSTRPWVACSWSIWVNTNVHSHMLAC